MQQIFNFKVEKRTIKRLYIQDILILVRKFNSNLFSYLCKIKHHKNYKDMTIPY